MTKIRNFLGLAGYYRRFVQGLSSISAPLTKLTRKNVPFVWDEKCEASFEELKRRLTIAPILTLPVGSGGFVVYIDASNVGLGCFNVSIPTFSTLFPVCAQESQSCLDLACGSQRTLAEFSGF